MVGNRPMRLIAAAIAALAFLPITGHAQQAQPHQSKWVKSHKVVIQIDSNDPAIYTLALNNAKNRREYYKKRGEPIQIEFVAFGPGLNMMLDQSPVKDRLVDMS